MTEEKRTDTTPEEHEDFASLLASQTHSSPARLQPGQKVTGTVIAVAGDTVFVDVGLKVDGIMERKDILNPEGMESVAPGDSVEAWVIGVNPQEIRLSRSMSGSGVAALEEARDAALPVDGRVVSACKGGFNVEVLGKTAFCPASQMEAFSGDADSMVGRTLRFLILRVENGGRNIVVSHRALMERERQENLDKLLGEIKEGDTVEGKITRLAPFGAFMELAPGVEGMIHISELSWSRVGQPDEAVSPGEGIRAKVLGITRNDKGQVRISLSRKQAEGDPWQNVNDSMTPGMVVTGRVARLVPFGAFVELLPGVEGLVHVSELSWAKRISKPEEILTQGEQVSVKIKEVNLAARRISLSLRDAEGDPWEDVARRFVVGSTVTGTVESRTQYGLFVTLAPGVTGLLPTGLMHAGTDKARLSKLDKGDSVTLIVQNVDVGARRISLAPEGSETASAVENSAWQQHAASGEKSTVFGQGLMARALQHAFSKK